MEYKPTLQRLPPKNWQDFELICLAIWRSIWEDESAQRHGRSGQAQHGVDVFGRPNKGKLWAGVQCKGKDLYPPAELTESVIRKEVENAKKIEPPIAEFTIATTARRDASIQKIARQITNEHKENGLFSVTVCAWDDIDELLNEYKPKLTAAGYSRGSCSRI